MSQSPLPTISTVLLALPLLCGCASDPQLDRPLANTPLPFDPTDDYELAEWWTNGDEVLHLIPDHGYAVYGDGNRYHIPTERGSWSQPNYAMLHFEPYDSLETRVDLVRLDRTSDGTLVLLMGDLKPMIRTPQPPHVLEDELIGRWESDERMVQLFEDGSYRFDRLTTLAPGTTGLRDHIGGWVIVEQVLFLYPAVGTLDPLRIPIAREAETASLRGMRRPS